jgi:[acyl-carrier-protein] S-malonyltransferase
MFKTLEAGMKSWRTLMLVQASTAMAFVLQPSTHTARLVGRVGSRRNLATTRMMSDTEFKDWKASTAFFFPGQGAQYVGMAGKLVAEVPKAKQMYQQASEILGYDLLKLSLEGPKDKLDSTVISQPAIYVASLAAVEKLRADAGQAAIDKATVAAGLSLGEYTALSFAGALRFEDGLRIVKTRGEAMQAASEAAESGMVSVIGLDIETVEKLCARTRELTGDSPTSTQAA